MADRSTKILLTVIALALIGNIVVELAPQPAKAQGGGCGSYDSPCFVWVKNN